MKNIFLKSVICFILTLGFAGYATAQASDYEYGSPAELKGLTKYTVYVGPEVEINNQISSEIEKAKVPGLVRVDDPEKAEIVLVFAATSQGHQRFGKGYVAKNIGSRDRTRVLISFEELRNVPFEKKPAVKFAREFVKQYRKANGL